MSVDLWSLKMEIVNLLRRSLTPNNESGDLEIPLDPSNPSIAQSFIPYSTCYRAGSPLKVEVLLRKEGTPGDITLRLYTGEEEPETPISGSEVSIPESQIRTMFVNEVFNVPLERTVNRYLESIGTYWLVLSGAVFSDDYYVLKRSSGDNAYRRGTAMAWDGSTWQPLNSDIVFRVETPTWIYPEYPRVELEKFYFPRAAVDIVSRRVSYPWISCRVAKADVNVAITVYSRYPKELDYIMSDIDQCIMENRTQIPSIVEMRLSTFSQTTVPLKDYFARTLFYTATVIHRLD